MANAPPSTTFDSEDAEKEENERLGQSECPSFYQKRKSDPKNTSNPADKKILLILHWLELRHLDSHPFLREKKKKKMGNLVFAFGVEKGEGRGIGGEN